MTSQLAEAVDSAATLRQEMDAQILESRMALKMAFSEFRLVGVFLTNMMIMEFCRKSDGHSKYLLI